MKIKNLFLAFVFLIIACDKSTTSDPLTPAINSDNPITTTPDTNINAGTQNPSVTEAFIELINQHRQSIGLAELILDQSMTVIVQAHSYARQTDQSPLAMEASPIAAPPPVQLWGP
jgi:uncharacterized protein YkwD